MRKEKENLLCDINIFPSYTPPIFHGTLAFIYSWAGYTGGFLRLRCFLFYIFL